MRSVSLPAVTGSSPLARGLPPRPGRRSSCARIIPARAGFTRRPRRTRPRPSDHPRSRGVYILADVGDSTEGGSSPLARGLPVVPGWGSRQGGIIPARAGFTIYGVGGGKGVGDHPRSRGVYPTKSGEFAQDQGSSPLARGLPPVTAHGRLGGGIIPARAGFTSSTVRACPSSPDHPRSRGVYFNTQLLAARSHGSSPLARGLPRACQYFPWRSGIIPARAGFTV